MDSQRMKNSLYLHPPKLMLMIQMSQLTPLPNQNTSNAIANAAGNACKAETNEMNPLHYLPTDTRMS
jgi:hypothetical protein